MWSWSKKLETFLWGTHAKTAMLKVVQVLVVARTIKDSGFACGRSNRKRVGLVLVAIAVERQNRMRNEQHGRRYCGPPDAVNC